MSCRQGDDFKGPWGAPTMMALEGGSFGFQIGGEATDFVLLVMNEDGDNRHVYGRKIPARDIVLSGTVAVPPAAAELISTLAARTPKHRA
jgi:lipid-binding SYLF domain-containing protein